MGLYSSIPLERPIEFVNVEPLAGNPMISKTRIKIAYHGKNRNDSFISKEVMTEMAMRSLALTPIVGRFVAEQGDFADHSIESIITPEGDLGRVRYTKVYGMVPEQPNASWEWFQEQDGTEREYLVCDGYLLTGRYPETLRIVQEGRNNQSMEIDPASVVGTWSQIPNSTEMSFVITEANFLGLCILGADVEPCFEGASFSANLAFENKGGISLYDILEREEKAKQKEVRNFMKELEFALNHDPSIVGIQKMDNEETKQGIQEAITDLDIAADSEPNPTSVQAIDNAIDTLLTVETQLDREDILVPNTETGAEALEEMVGEAQDITSSPNFDKAIPITKLSEEETVMNPEEILNQAEKPVVNPAAPAVVPPVADPAGVAAQPAVAPQPRVSADEKRQAMAAQPGQAEGSAAEKMQDVIRAMQEMEQLKAAFVELAQTIGIDPASLQSPAAPNAGQEPVGAPVEKTGDEAKAEEAPAKADETPVKTEAPADKPEGEAPAAVDPAEEEKKKKAPVFASEDEDKKKEAVQTETGDITVEKDAEDDKKKEFEELGDIKQNRVDEGVSKATGAGPAEPSTATDVKQAEMSPSTPDVQKGDPSGQIAPPEVKKDSNIVSYQAHINDLNKELDFLRAENKALKEFKAQAEVDKKESVLKEFSFLPEEKQAELRADFSKYSVEDLEAHCALYAFRSGLNGQNTAVNDGIVSYSHEGAASVSSADLEISKAMSQIQNTK